MEFFCFCCFFICYLKVRYAHFIISLFFVRAVRSSFIPCLVLSMNVLSFVLVILVLFFVFFLFLNVSFMVVRRALIIHPGECLDYILVQGLLNFLAIVLGLKDWLLYAGKNGISNRYVHLSLELV